MARVNYVQATSPARMQPVWDMISAELVAHGMFSLVETVNSPGGMPCAVFKASGAQSRLGRDWYLFMARVIANPDWLYFAVAEGYDPATKKVIRPAPGTASTSTIPAEDGSYGGGAAYPIWSGTTGNTLNTADIRWSGTQGYSMPSDAWTVVTKDGLFMWGHPPGRAGAYLFGVYAGTIEPLQANDPGILGVGDFLNRNSPTDGASFITTRHPTVTTAMPYTWNWMQPSNPSAAWTPSVGQINGPGDRLFNARPVGGRRVLRTAFTGANLSTYGDLRGLWPGLLAISNSGGGTGNDTVMPGETMTIYDQKGVGSSYIYAYRYGSGGNELWINTTTP